MYCIIVYIQYIILQKESIKIMKKPISISNIFITLNTVSKLVIFNSCKIIGKLCLFNLLRKHLSLI